MLNSTKCNMLSRKVSYFEHIFSTEGARTETEIISAAEKWSSSEDVQQLWSHFLLWTCYSKFVMNFSNIAKPFLKLIDSKQKFLWTKEFKIAFKRLKKALISSPVLMYPKPDAVYLRHIYWSRKYGICFVTRNRLPEACHYSLELKFV